MNSLPSEIEIISRSKGDWNKPLVTFLCTSYNQQDYIEQTIIGFLSQKTSFPYEILIHDDKSTDETQTIIESYRLKYPNLIKCIYQSENQYSQGKSPLLIAGTQCKAEYVALCEGDDYWINENKIENQFNLITSDNSISMILSPGKLEANGKVLDKLDGFHGKELKEISAQEIVNDVGQFAPTASYMLKKDFLIESTKLFIESPVADTFIELYSAVFGKLIYCPEVGSVYRTMANNSWSKTMLNDELNNYLRFTEKMKNTINKSKEIKGFENLDWSFRLAALHYNLAKIYLKNKNFDSFKENIQISKEYGSIKSFQKILFYFKSQPNLLFFSLKYLLAFKKS